MQNLFQEGAFNQKTFHKIIVKALLTNTTNENYLNQTIIPKMLFSCQLLNRPQLYLFINAFNNWDAHYNDNCQTCDS